MSSSTATHRYEEAIAMATQRHEEAIANADAALALSMEDATKQLKANTELQKQMQLEADALSYRKMLAAAAAVAAAAPPPPPYAERPKAKKRPEGMSDADWEKDCKRRQKNATNTAYSMARLKSLGLKPVALTDADRERRLTMTTSEINAEIYTKKAETLRLRKERQDLLAILVAGGGV